MLRSQSLQGKANSPAEQSGKSGAPPATAKEPEARIIEPRIDLLTTATARVAPTPPADERRHGPGRKLAATPVGTGRESPQGAGGSPTKSNACHSPMVGPSEMPESN